MLPLQACSVTSPAEERTPASSMSSDSSMRLMSPAALAFNVPGSHGSVPG